MDKEYTENDYRLLALELVDLAVQSKVYWLVTSGFENADHLILMGEASKLDRGYWELVYVSIASNIDSYDVEFKGYNT